MGLEQPGDTGWLTVTGLGLAHHESAGQVLDRSGTEPTGSCS